MAKEIFMPKIGMTDGDIQLIEYMKNEGDPVKEGDVLFTMESEKVNGEAEAPIGGVVLKIYADPGSSMPIGSLVMVIGEAGEDISGYGKKAVPAAKPAPVKEEPAQPAIEPRPVKVSGGQDTTGLKVTPAARKAAEKNGVNLADLAAALGLSRRIQIEDVEKYVSLNKAEAAEQKIESVPGEAGRIPVTSMRKIIANRMYESMTGMAQTSVSAEIDVTELVSFREALLGREEELGTRITMTDIFSLAVLRMLKDHPLANAEWRGNEILTYPYVHLSIAVATDYGLTSPVVRDADKMSLAELSKAIASVVAHARGKKLLPDEVAGGTFTITNMGIFPVDAFTPIINPPQSAIMGFGRITEKPAVIEGRVLIRKMMTVSLTYDHRVFDGSDAGYIMRDMKKYLEQPALIYQ